MTDQASGEIVELVIADDHRMFVQAIVLLLERSGGVEVREVADNGDDLLDMLARLSPAVALVDVSMPGPGAVGIIEKVKEAGWATRLIALTMHLDKEVYETLMAHGYAGYVVKDCAFEDLMSAIQAVAKGGVFVSDVVNDSLDLSVETSPLTPRETECLGFAADGTSNKAIAERLGVSVRTVKYHFENILRKLEAQSRGQAVAIARRRGLLRPVPLT